MCRGHPTTTQFVVYFPFSDYDDSARQSKTKTQTTGLNNFQLKINVNHGKII